MADAAQDISLFVLTKPDRGADPGGGGPPSRSARLADTLVAISDGMENQIGLRLEPEKISAEVIVIDQIEKPSPN